MDETRASTPFVVALLGGDAAAAAALYTDDGKLLTTAARLIAGRAEIEAYWREGIAVGLDRVELDPAETEVVGDLAVEIGRYLFATAEACEQGTYLVLHRREADGAWRRAVDVYNPEGER